MFFSEPVAPLPKITAPTAAEICVQSKPSPQGRALLKPEMTPAEYFHTLEKNKLPVDSMNFLAHGLPEKDGICWACQSARLTAPKLSLPELDSLKLTENWLKIPTPELRASIGASLGKLDFTGPASWAAQAAMWAKIPGMPAIPAIPGMPAVNLVAAAIGGAVLLAVGLKLGAAMPPIPMPKLPLPMAPPTLALLAQLQKPQIPQLLAIPALDQLKLVKPMLPFLDIGRGVARGTIRCF